MACGRDLQQPCTCMRLGQPPCMHVRSRSDLAAFGGWKPGNRLSLGLDVLLQRSAVREPASWLHTGPSVHCWKNMVKCSAAGRNIARTPETATALLANSTGLPGSSSGAATLGFTCALHRVVRKVLKHGFWVILGHTCRPQAHNLGPIATNLALYIHGEERGGEFNSLKKLNSRHIFLSRGLWTKPAC